MFVRTCHSFCRRKGYVTTQVIRGRARANKDKNNAPESESQWLNSSTCQSMNWIGKEHRHESFLSSATQRSLENSLLDVNSTGRVEKKNAKKTEEKKLIVLSKKWRLIGVERQKAKQSRPKQQSRAGDGAPRVSERNRRERKRRRPPFFRFIPFFSSFFFLLFN